MEFRQKGENIRDDPPGVLILNPAVLHRDDVMRARLVDPADKFPAHHAEGRLHLAAVMIRLVHPQNGRDGTEPADQPLHEPLLPPELIRVFEILKLTAAAFARIGAPLAPGALHGKPGGRLALLPRGSRGPAAPVRPRRRGWLLPGTPGVFRPAGAVGGGLAAGRIFPFSLFSHLSPLRRQPRPQRARPSAERPPARRSGPGSWR